MPFPVGKNAEFLSISVLACCEAIAATPFSDFIEVTGAAGSLQCPLFKQLSDVRRAESFDLPLNPTIFKAKARNFTYS